MTYCTMICGLYESVGDFVEVALLRKVSAVDRLNSNLWMGVTKARNLLGYMPLVIMEEYLQQAMRGST